MRSGVFFAFSKSRIMAFMMIATITKTAHSTSITASGLLLRFFTSSAIFLSLSVLSLYCTAGDMRALFGEIVTGLSTSPLSSSSLGTAGLEVSFIFLASMSACEEDARAVAQLVEERFPKLQGKVLINNIGTTIGCHTGPGTVALFFWGKSRA